MSIEMLRADRQIDHLISAGRDRSGPAVAPPEPTQAAALADHAFARDRLEQGDGLGRRLPPLLGPVLHQARAVRVVFQHLVLVDRFFDE